MARYGQKKPASAGSMILIIVVLSIFVGIMLFSGYRQDKLRADLEARCSKNVTADVTKVTFEKKTRKRTVTRHRRTRRVTEHYTEYVYTISYKADGKTYVTTETNEDHRLYYEGQTVDMKYDPKDPAVCFVPRPDDGKSFKSSLMASSFLIIIVAVLLISLLSKAVKTRRHSTNAVGQTFEEWQAEQQARQRQEEFYNSSGGSSMIGSVDPSFTAAGGGENYMKEDDLNSTSGFMDSI